MSRAPARAEDGAAGLLTDRPAGPGADTWPTLELVRGSPLCKAGAGDGLTRICAWFLARVCPEIESKQLG